MLEAEAKYGAGRLLFLQDRFAVEATELDLNSYPSSSLLLVTTTQFNPRSGGWSKTARQNSRRLVLSVFTLGPVDIH